MESNKDNIPKMTDLDEILALQADHDIFEELKIGDIKDKILDDVQANILKSTKHLYTLFCFFTFKPEHKKTIVNWLKHLRLTSAREQIETEQEKSETEGKSSSGNMIGLYLSYQGYEFFCDPEKIKHLIRFEDEDIFAFQEGLAKRCPRAFGAGEDDYKHPSHALILIATDDARLKEVNDVRGQKESTEAQLFQLFAEWATPPVKDFDAFEENYGKVFFEIGMRNPEGSDGLPREWFGFRDGISNPRFFPDRGRPNPPGFVPDEPAPLDVALRRNRLAGNYACGSFVVFLKLEQNDKAFKRMVKELAGKLGMEDYKGLAAAYIIGRHKDGTPLHEAFNFPTLGDRNRNLNDFDYGNDQDGAVCPMHAHIRKANPRDGQAWGRIVRRGKVYGRDNSKNKGILFLSYQSSLLAFEDMVNRGLYGYKYKNKILGKDMLFVNKGEYQGNHRYRNASGYPRSPYLRAEKLVEFKGGQYFFASSISFIQKSLENFI